MNKLISSSIWNFISNFIIRFLSIITYPFLVRHFFKEDISLFKASQSLILILVTIIPFGSRELFISAPDKFKKKRWKVTFYVSITIGLILLIIVNLKKNIFGDLFGAKYKFLNNSIYSLIIIAATLKTLLLNLLINKIDFKSISIALLIKQFLLYSLIILFSFLFSFSNILIKTLICVELLEVVILGFFVTKNKLRLIPEKNIELLFDKTVAKFVGFLSIEQLFNVLAIHFPAIFVVYIFGKQLAPEFQLPFYAINVPVSLIMISVAKVIFPYMSEIRDSIVIRKTLLSIEFVLTLFIIPILITISLLNQEIISILFKSSWSYAAFAIKYFPIMLFVNVLNNPFTSIAAIKEKPHIILIYSILLFVFRMSAIYFGYLFYGFKGAVISFIIADVIVRLFRLKVDLNLINLRVNKFIYNIKYNLLSIIIYLGFYFFAFQIVKDRIISVIIGFIFWIFFIIVCERSRLFVILKKIIIQIQFHPEKNKKSYF